MSRFPFLPGSGRWIPALRCAQPLGRLLARGRGILVRTLKAAWSRLLAFLAPRPPVLGYLEHLMKLRMLEGALASRLGSLAQAALGQGLRESSRRFARAAFQHWCRARRAEARLLLPEGDPLRHEAL